MLPPITSLPIPRPTTERVLMFGEGNFLRAFIGSMVDAQNAALGLDMGIVAIQPIARGMSDVLNSQNGLYTVLSRGVRGGETRRDRHVVGCLKRVVDPYADFAAYLALSRQEAIRVVLSNTTEAGIAFSETDRFDDAPPASYPAKLTRLLYERYAAFGGASGSGWHIIPCELIDHNGAALRDCVTRVAKLWSLPADFLRWLEEENAFHDTLVDRIVTGYPRTEADALEAEWGYADRAMVVTEPFSLWVVQNADKPNLAPLPFSPEVSDIVYTDDVTPYKLRKVRMLNGAHTTITALGFLCGHDTVGECVDDPAMRTLLETAMYQEILPCVPLPEDTLRAFAASVLERFRNPFNRHLLQSIALNSASKFVARVLPTIREYARGHGRAPEALTRGFAGLCLYLCGCARGEDGAWTNERGTLDGGRERYVIQDEERALSAFAAIPRTLPPAEIARRVCALDAVWGETLSDIPDFETALAAALAGFRTAPNGRILL